jgi:hypothetical protein
MPQDLLFCKLTAAKIVRLFTHVLMEKRIVFFADQHSTLHVIAESICALIYPFYWQVWSGHAPFCTNATAIIFISCCPSSDENVCLVLVQHVYIPLLPASMMGFIQAPMPFIVGIHRYARPSKQASRFYI